MELKSCWLNLTSLAVFSCAEWSAEALPRPKAYAQQAEYLPLGGMANPLCGCSFHMQPCHFKSARFWPHGEKGFDIPEESCVRGSFPLVRDDKSFWVVDPFDVLGSGCS